MTYSEVSLQIFIMKYWRFMVFEHMSMFYKSLYWNNSDFWFLVSEHMSMGHLQYSSFQIPADAPVTWHNSVQWLAKSKFTLWNFSADGTHYVFSTIFPLFRTFSTIFTHSVCGKGSILDILYVVCSATFDTLVVKLLLVCGEILPSVFWP